MAAFPRHRWGTAFSCRLGAAQPAEGTQRVLRRGRSCGFGAESQAAGPRVCRGRGGPGGGVPGPQRQALLPHAFDPGTWQGWRLRRKEAPEGRLSKSLCRGKHGKARNLPGWGGRPRGMVTPHGAPPPLQRAGHRARPHCGPGHASQTQGLGAASLPLGFLRLVPWLLPRRSLASIRPHGLWPEGAFRQRGLCSATCLPGPSKVRPLVGVLRACLQPQRSPTSTGLLRCQEASAHRQPWIPPPGPQGLSGTPAPRGVDHGALAEGGGQLPPPPRASPAPGPIQKPSARARPPPGTREAA